MAENPEEEMLGIVISFRATVATLVEHIFKSQWMKI